jgi:hypothetical protein
MFSTKTKIHLSAFFCKQKALYPKARFFCPLFGMVSLWGSERGHAADLWLKA